MEFKGQVGQDKWVCEKLNHKRNGYFMDIGAYDGIKLSNTYYLEKEMEWDGVCIEPAKGAFLKLMNNRSCLNIRSAVSNSDGYAEFLEEGMIGRLTEGADQTIKTQTLRTIINSFNLPRFVDYVSLDVEGSEYDVLLGFPFDLVDVSLWTIEHNSYLDGGVLKAKIKDIMLSNGYVIDREDILCGGLAFEDWYVNKKLL